MTTRPGQPMDRDKALRLSVVVEKRARADADAWLVSLRRRGRLIAAGRARQVIDGSATSTDPLRTQVMQEWYVRVFEDQMRRGLGISQPKVAVTDTETEHVAECLREGVAFRILGPGGSVVMNPDSDRLAPGQDNFAGHEKADQEREDIAREETWHRAQTQALADAQEHQRQDEEQIMAAAWTQLSPEQRADFAAYWHQLHGSTGPTAWPRAADYGARPRSERPATYTATDTGARQPVPGSPAEAAAAVFAREPLPPGELNAARELAAQAFPTKPPKINRHGTERSGVFIPPRRDAPEDRGRGR